MKFSCARCGQRYYTDEPQPGQSYRVSCLACDATLLVKGGEFPALPTLAGSAADPARFIPDAVAEEPVALALTALAQRGPSAVARRPIPRSGTPRGQVRVRRWGRLAAASGVALATLGAGALLFSGGPEPEPRLEAKAPRPASETKALLAGRTAVPDSRPWRATPPTPVRASVGEPARFHPARADPVGAAASSAPPPVAPSPPTKLGRPPALRARVASGRLEAVPAAKPAASPAGEAPAGPLAAEGAEPEAATVPSAVEVPPLKAAAPTPEDVAATVAARRPEFNACVQEAWRAEPDLFAGDPKLAVVMTVNPNGMVTSPQIEGPLQGTSFGECLRNVVRNLPFPAFDGEPFLVRIPVVLGR